MKNVRWWVWMVGVVAMMAVAGVVADVAKTHKDGQEASARMKLEEARAETRKKSCADASEAWSSAYWACQANRGSYLRSWLEKYKLKKQQSQDELGIRYAKSIAEIELLKIAVNRRDKRLDELEKSVDALLSESHRLQDSEELAWNKLKELAASNPGYSMASNTRLRESKPDWLLELENEHDAVVEGWNTIIRSVNTR